MARGKKQVEQPDAPTVDLVSRGEDAKRLDNDEYFKDLRARFVKALDDELLMLSASAVSRFVEIKTLKDAMNALSGMMYQDMREGAKALAQKQGEVKQGRVA